MAAQYNEIQELLRSRADLHVRLKLMPSVILNFRITEDESIKRQLFVQILI